MSEEAKELPPPSPLRALINLLPLLILTWYLCVNRPGENPHYQLEACGRSLHKIGVALEKDRLLSEDRLYTEKLKSAMPEGSLPACPEGGVESYVQGYQVAADRASYLLVCKGSHHTEAGVPPDYPRIAFSVNEATADQNGQQEEEQTETGQEAGERQEGQLRQEEVESSSPIPQATPDTQ